MRYLGNKESLTDEIVTLLRKENLLNINDRKVFFDAFCGTGTVSNSIKNYCDIILNDNLRLIDFLDIIKSKKCKILISNILDYKGKENIYLKKWIKDNDALVKNIKVRGREEVLVTYE